MEIEKIIDYVSSHCWEFGWKASDGGIDAWKNDEGLYEFSFRVKKVPSKRLLSAIKRRFNAKNIEYLGKKEVDEPFIVITISNNTKMRCV